MPDLNLGGLAAQLLHSVNPALGGGDQLWAIAARHIEASAVTARAARDGRLPGAAANRRGEPYGGNTFMRRIGNVAIVPVMGPLVSRMSWQYWSYDEIIRDLRMASADETVAAVLIDGDSPGGMVANVEAAAAEIARTAAAKPLAVHIGGIGASAMYWLAAAAGPGNVSAAPSSLVGSVGALIRYLDIEGIFTKLGARVVEVIAEQSPNKRLDPDSAEGRAELQAIADDGAEMFLRGLEASRGVSRATIMADYGQGLVFPAAAALERGMIDRIESFEETLAGLAARAAEPKGAATATVQNGQETIMADDKTETQGKPAASDKPVTVEGLRAAHGDLIGGIEKASADTATAAERSRVAAIMALAKPGREALIASMVADGTAASEASAKILAAIDAGELSAGDAGNRTATDVLERMDRAAEGVTSTPSGTATDGKTAPKANTPEGWEAEWHASDELQAEFPTAASYVATMKKDGRKAA